MNRPCKLLRDEETPSAGRLINGSEQQQLSRAEGLTCRTAAAVERALGVVAGDSGVAGARLDGEGTLVHVLNARRVPRRRLPAAVTDALIPRLDDRQKSEKEETHTGR